ncbi:pentapeptide repeat-containing protein (plasmid) [Acaryochloris sp. CCMEE 5410]|nr:pentapeptide repeat-containing protein [Acaryochloris sp. CCMEE 5410]
MNGVCRGSLPGVCIDGKWRFSERELSKFCSQYDSVLLGTSWDAGKRNPYSFEDAIENKSGKVIEAYDAGERYFPSLGIKGGRFEGLDLREIDFWQSELRGADFTGATLKGAIFVLANLEHAVFRNADLTQANFERAWVDHADFSGAILNRALFAVSSMRGVKLDGAKINLVEF